MNHNIVNSLVHLAYPIDKLQSLKGNPQVSDIEAIMAVLTEFGQHNVITVNGTEEEGGYVVAGNHRLQAAKKLGWTHVAVAFVDEDAARSLARAVSDNRISELGHTDPYLLSQIMPTIMDDYYEVLDVLQWDDFEIAALQESTAVEPPEVKGYVAPEIRNDTEVRQSTIEGRSEKDLITTGAGNTDEKRNAVVQYTLVFDSPEQQARWHSFVRWLRSDPATEGETTAEKLMYFLESVADF